MPSQICALAVGKVNHSRTWACAVLTMQSQIDFYSQSHVLNSYSQLFNAGDLEGRSLRHKFRGRDRS